MSNNTPSRFDISSLKCPICRTDLKYKTEKGLTAVVCCCLHKFPLVNGVLYLKNDRLAKKAVMYITRKKRWAAYTVLLNLNKKLLFIFLLLNTKVKIPFGIFIRLVILLGMDKKWAEYLLKRKFADSYKTTADSIKSFKQSGKVLDFGCGIGQLLPPISNVIGRNNLYAIDSSFVNLIIARKYFTSPNTLLICTDGEFRLPFANNTFNRVVATDSFHYLKNKNLFISECDRILQRRGQLLLFQTISSVRTVFGNIRGIKPKKLQKLLLRHNFRKINIIPNQVYDKTPYNVIASK